MFMGLCFALTFGSGRTQTDLEQSSVLLCADREHIQVLRMLLNTLSQPLLSCLRVPAQRFLVELLRTLCPLGSHLLEHCGSVPEGWWHGSSSLEETPCLTKNPNEYFVKRPSPCSSGKGRTKEWRGQIPSFCYLYFLNKKLQKSNVMFYKEFPPPLN